MPRFLIDECCTVKLVELANVHGFEAHHVTRRGWSSKKDPFLYGRILEEQFIFVTINWRDFEPMLARTELHPGAVIIPDVPREQQARLFELALRLILATNPPLDLVNTVMQVDEDGTVSIYDLP